MPAFAPIPHLKDPDLLRFQALGAEGWTDADKGGVIEVTNPATGAVIGTVPRLGAAETDRAIAAAHAAFGPWSRMLAKERAAILRRWFALIVHNTDDLAAIMTAEQGKPWAEAKGEIAYAAAFIEWFAEEAKRLYGDTIPAPFPNRRLLVVKQPVGVCGAITPWNFPAAMITRKLGPALAAGCTMVCKPASATPLTALALAVLGERAGLPAGVFQVVTGGAAEIAQALTRHPQVRKISFTGSTEIGRALMAAAAGQIQRISLELGGNAPFLVFDDADLDQAVQGCIQSKFRNAGQTCVCANRIYVQDGVFDAFAEKLVAAVRALPVGDGFAPGVQIGPLIDRAAVDKVEQHVADATAKGARVLLGGARHERGGLFYQPTVLAGARQDMLCAREETFGPVAPLFRFATEEEGVRLANATEFGLAAYFYARDVGRVMRVAEGIEAGMVGVNAGLISTEVAPFGGVKQSGLGREGSFYGMDEYVAVKQISLGF